MFKGATDIVVKPVQTYNERSKMKSAEMEDAISSGSQTPTRSASASLAPPSSEALERPRSAGPGSSSGSTSASGSTTGAVLKASASGVGGFFKAYGKFYVDVPLAVTDGLRNVPKLYGEKVEQRKPINDWKSGTIEGGKHFVVGLSEGFADLFVQPYKGGRDGGAAGAALGVGKGVLNMATKTASGMWQPIAPGFASETNIVVQQHWESWRILDKASTRAYEQSFTRRRVATSPQPAKQKASIWLATATLRSRLSCTDLIRCAALAKRRKRRRDARATSRS